jgi:putative peptide zinc metalloprotease protein
MTAMAATGHEDADGGRRVFAITPGVTITELDVAPAGRFLLHTPRGRFMVSAPAVSLIRRLDAGAALDEVARSPREAEALGRFLQEQVLPTGVFGGAEDTTAATPTPRGTYLHSGREILGAAALRPWTGALRHLFHPPLAAVLLALSAAAQAWFWSGHLGLRLEDLSAGSYALGIVVLLLTFPLHELGHGAACRHFGCEHGGMGFAMYLVFPCLYTDVSDAWRLPRWSRVAVDLGGVYFQVLGAGLLAALGLATGHPAWVAALVLTSWSILCSLRPYLRSDGYWVLVDVLGVPAPHERVKEYLGYLLRPARLRGAAPLLARLAPGLRRFAVAYVLVATAVAAWVVAALSWKTLTVVLPGYPAVVARLSAGPAGTAAWYGDALLGLGQTVLIGSLSLALWSAARAGARWARREA